MVRVGVGLGPVAWSMRSVNFSTAVWRELSKAANCADSMPALTQPAGHVVAAAEMSGSQDVGTAGHRLFAVLFVLGELVPFSAS